MEERRAESNRKFVIRALTDPEFRERLASAPDRALGKEFSDVNRTEARLILAAVAGIEAQIAALADELLCANGGCGIAVG